MRWWVVAAALGLVVGATAACAPDDGPRSQAPRPRPAGQVAVASFDFPESRLVAEVYAQALEDEGVDVDRQLGLGPREVVLPALRQGLVDVVPEYAGSALDAALAQVEAEDPGQDLPLVDRTDAESTAAALAVAVAPWDLAVLEPSAASNQNALVVTDTFATEHGVLATSDLVDEAPGLVIGGPPECPGRPRCLAGLRQRYGLEFGSFVALGGQDLVSRALRDGVVDVGVLFTTDAVLADASLVVLADDRGLQPADNVVPVVREAVLQGDDRVRAALDEVSARLTTTGLRFLNWRVANGGRGVAAEARAWLIRQGLVAR